MKLEIKLLNYLQRKTYKTPKEIGEYFLCNPTYSREVCEKLFNKGLLERQKVNGQNSYRSVSFTPRERKSELSVSETQR